MLKNFTKVTLDGYGSGETDFRERLNQADPEVQQAFELNIIEPLVAVLNSADQTAVLKVEGQADRVDTEGLSREERRQQSSPPALRGQTARRTGPSKGSPRASQRVFPRIGLT